MVVVDSMRFPYIEGTGSILHADAGRAAGGPTTVPQPATANAVYSVQRFQPYRGGHAVPMLTGAMPAVGTPLPVDARYGYSEQIVVPTANSQHAGHAQASITCRPRRQRPTLATATRSITPSAGPMSSSMARTPAARRAG